MDKIIEFAKTTGFYMLFGNMRENWTSLVMILISLFLLYLGIKKQFEPLLLRLLPLRPQPLFRVVRKPFQARCPAIF